MNLGIRGSPNTCLHFHRARCPHRAVNHPRVDRRLLSLPCPSPSLSPLTWTISIFPYMRVQPVDRRNNTHTHLHLVTYTKLRGMYAFTILFDLALGRHMTPTPKMNMNFSRRGKLSNEFSARLSPCVLLPTCVHPAIREMHRFASRSPARGRRSGKTIDRRSIAQRVCHSVLIVA